MPAPKGNKFAIGHKGTKMFPTVKSLKNAIEKYFNHCDNNTAEVYIKSSQELKEIKKPIPYTIEGLCEVLECDRDTLLNYEKKKGYEDYFGTVKKAKMKIQRNKLERGLLGDSNSAVTIFDLKNNHNYKDKTETDITSKGECLNITASEYRQISKKLDDEF